MSWCDAKKKKKKSSLTGNRDDVQTYRPLCFPSDAPRMGDAPSGKSAGRYLLLLCFLFLQYGIVPRAITRDIISLHRTEVASLLIT